LRIRFCCAKREAHIAFEGLTFEAAMADAQTRGWDFINMPWFRCPQCAKAHDLGGTTDTDRERERG